MKTKIKLALFLIFTATSLEIGAQNPFTDPPPETPDDNLTALTELRSVKDACAALGYASGDAQKNCTQDLGWAASECTEETPQPQPTYGTVTDAQKDAYREAHKQCVVDKANGVS